ncbi:MAG: hypothetical protein HY707_08260 [Ignavibacteriae bacterium]|nr:hypothetical protein [Ignavibacteriota bacterium]
MKRNVHHMLVFGFLTVLIFSLVFLTSTTVLAQCPLTMDVRYVPVDKLSFADIDFEHFESRSLLFTVIINNPSKQSYSPKLIGRLDVRLAEGNVVYDMAVIFKTDTFGVPPSSSKTITNMDLGGIGFEEYEFSPNAKSDLQDISLATGKLPAGVYNLHLELEQTGCDLRGDVKLVLRNLSRVELRSPRDGEVTNEFPFFEFFHEGDRARLLITEKNPDQSREEAIERRPPMLDEELTGQNSFPYSRGRPLEQGKTYAWRVVSKMRGTGGTDNEISSPIWIFTVTNSGEELSESVLLDQLEALFRRRYPALFQQIRKQKYRLSGNCTLNGLSLSYSELLNLLYQLRENADSAELSFE